MRYRPFASVLTVAIAALTVAACGSSSSSSSVSAPTPASGSSGGPSVTAGSGGGTYTTSGSSGGASGSSALAAGVARCKASIASAPTLSAGSKSKLESLCDQAGSGNAAQLRKVSAQVCQQIVKESVPASAQQQALAACPKP